jgi:type II secretory pathway component PulC
MPLTSLAKFYPTDKLSLVLSMKDVKQRLQAEDDAAVKKGESSVVQANVTQSSFILQGIEIEETQYVVARYLGNCLD